MIAIKQVIAASTLKYIVAMMAKETLAPLAPDEGVFAIATDYLLYVISREGDVAEVEGAAS